MTTTMDDIRYEAYTTDNGTPANNPVPSVRSPTRQKATEYLKKKISLFSIDLSELDNVKPRTVLTIQQVVILIGLIVLVILVLQIPTILYYTNQPPSSSTRISFFNDVDFDTCSVS